MSSNASISSNGSTGSISSGVSALATMSNVFASAKDTFDKSGGNQLLSSVSATIPQGTKDYINNARSKFFSREQIRPVSVFFGIGEEKPFYVERVPSLIMDRLRHNLLFFYMNYTLLTAVLFCFTLVISPSAIIGIGLLGFTWLAVVRSTTNNEGYLKVGPLSFNEKQVTIGMSTFSAIVLFYLLRHIFWWAVGSSGVLVSVHAFLRDASLHKDMEDKIEMTGDIGVGSGGGIEEEASFLNSQNVV